MSRLSPTERYVLKRMADGARVRRPEGKTDLHYFVMPPIANDVIAALRGQGFICPSGLNGRYCEITTEGRAALEDE